MSLEIKEYVLGPLENNTFILIDSESNNIAIVDPAFGSGQLVQEIHKNNWSLTHILCTHAHFDHIAGINELQEVINKNTMVCLHEKDLTLWHNSGGAKEFGLDFSPSIEPNMLLQEEPIPFGDQEIRVYYTPGHTAGHVVYHLAEQNTVFCGDLIFRMSVGRTDLQGGSHLLLLKSIDQKIKTLPDHTRLLCGHGPETTVGLEKNHNPYL